MKPLRSLLTIAAATLISASAMATTVIPPTWDQLVGEAQLIFQGTVTDVQSRWEGEGKNHHIQTYVTFKVDDQIKGKAGNSYTISMLGGTVGEQTMEVSDGPKFKTGDRDILFVENNGSQFIPLVGIMHGRFRVQRDSAGNEFIATHDGAPLTDLTQLGHEEAAAKAVGAPITPQNFKSTVRTTLARLPQ
ncbi:MAG: hypothetical protein ACJ8I9_00155 [Chthoniobacterales bacterium]